MFKAVDGSPSSSNDRSATSNIKKEAFLPFPEFTPLSDMNISDSVVRVRPLNMPQTLDSETISSITVPKRVSKVRNQVSETRGESGSKIEPLRRTTRAQAKEQVIEEVLRSESSSDEETSSSSRRRYVLRGASSRDSVADESPGTQVTDRLGRRIGGRGGQDQCPHCGKTSTRSGISRHKCRHEGDSPATPAPKIPRLEHAKIPQYEPVKVPRKDPAKIPQYEPVKVPRKEPAKIPQYEPVKVPRKEPAKIPRLEPTLFSASKPVAVAEAEKAQLPPRALFVPVRQAISSDRSSRASCSMTPASLERRADSDYSSCRTLIDEKLKAYRAAVVDAFRRFLTDALKRC